MADHGLAVRSDNLGTERSDPKVDRGKAQHDLRPSIEALLVDLRVGDRNQSMDCRLI